MRHFVTGGSGFFGLHLLDRLLRENQEVVVYDTVPLDPEYVRKPGISFVQGDVRDAGRMREAMRGSDVVHHNAAVLPISRSGSVFREVNVGGTQNVLTTALEEGVKKVLFVSTSVGVYGIPSILPVTEETPLTPLGAYGRSKYEAEEIVRTWRSSHAVDVSIVRPRTIVGTGRLGIFGLLFEWIFRGKRVYVIGRGDNLFQLLSAPDLASACFLMTVRDCRNEDFNLGASTYGTVREDLEALIRHAGTAARIRPTNAFIVRNLLRIVDILRLSPLVDLHYKTPHKPFYFDCSKAERMLGWKARDGNISMLTQTYDWYVSRRDAIAGLTGTTHRKNVKQGILKVIRALS